MTWSIVAFDPATRMFGVCVATRSLAVGASCPFLRSGVGAVSTQSLTNRYLGPAILDALEQGAAPDEAIVRALQPDAGRHLRQVHAVDTEGRTAAWTGNHCVPWCGTRSATGVSVAGNMLAGERVVEATLETYLHAAASDMAERLLAAMDAGETAGGDRRGRQSAAMQIITSEDFPDLDLRVDDHSQPLAELRRLIGLWREGRAERKAWAPTKANPSGSADIDAIEAQWQARGLDLRFRR